MTINHDFWRNPLLVTLVEHLAPMTTKLYEQTGQRCITRITIASEIGLSLGLLPGQTMQVATPTGYVDVCCEDRNVRVTSSD